MSVLIALAALALLMLAAYRGYSVILFAPIAALGAVLLTVNTHYRRAEIEYLLKQSDCENLVLIDGFRDIGSNSNPDAPAREFQKFSTTFTTGPAPAVPPSAVAFSDVVEIASNPAAGESYTSIEMSPALLRPGAPKSCVLFSRWSLTDRKSVV